MNGTLFDQGLPRSSAVILRASGMHAVHVGELGMAMASDLQILDYARQHGLVVVTLDADFHAKLASTNAASPSVVRIRQQGLRAKETAEIVIAVLTSFRDAIEAGAVASVSGGLVRLKRLPIRSGRRT